jgi:hypothetical protein
MKPGSARSCGNVVHGLVTGVRSEDNPRLGDMLTIPTLTIDENGNLDDGVTGCDIDNLQHARVLLADGGGYEGSSELELLQDLVEHYVLMYAALLEFQENRHRELHTQVDTDQEHLLLVLNDNASIQAGMRIGGCVRTLAKYLPRFNEIYE